MQDGVTSHTSSLPPPRGSHQAPDRHTDRHS